MNLRFTPRALLELDQVLTYINAVGGDCPGTTELHRDILMRAGIFVEYAPQTRIEGEIQSGVAA